MHKWLLQKNAGYSIGNASPVDFLAALEPRLLHLNAHDVVKHDIRVCIAGLLERVRQTSNVTIDEQRALKQLNRDKTIIVLPADKRRPTVVLDRQDYVDKAEPHLGDTTAYVLLGHNPLPSSVTGLCKVVDRLSRLGKLSPSKFDPQMQRPQDSMAFRRSTNKASPSVRLFRYEVLLCLDWPNGCPGGWKDSSEYSKPQ